MLCYSHYKEIMVMLVKKNYHHLSNNEIIKAFSLVTCTGKNAINKYNLITTEMHVYTFIP